MDDVLCTHRGMGLCDGAERLQRLGPRLLLVQDSPAGPGDDTHPVVVTPLLEFLGIGGKVTKWTGLDDIEPGLGHLLPRLSRIHLCGVVGEPHSPLVWTHTDGELGKLRVNSVDRFGHHRHSSGQ